MNAVGSIPAEKRVFFFSLRFCGIKGGGEGGGGGGEGGMEGKKKP